ncbi:MAG: hybrid sensor histidine kinase/response regulator [Gammaproteobacteria bacterium]|nr:hybrid sensor histidine kinase/response regulator [Gammaproteobacteria bacterium]
MAIDNKNNTSMDMPARKIQAERIRILYRQANSVLLGNILIASLLTVGLYNLTDDILTLYWLAVVVAFTLFRFVLARLYIQDQNDDDKVIVWGYIFAATTFVSGSLWGVTAILFLQIHNNIIMLFMLMTLTGIMVGSAASLSNFAWSYYAFAIPTSFPFALALMLEGSIEFTVLGSMLLVFLILQLVLARKSQNSIDESIALRNANTDLIMRLDSKIVHAESASAAKTRFLAAASHDLRQPMHAMGLFLDILQVKNKDPEQSEIIAKIRKSSQALGGLLGSLLDISKLDAGIVTIEKKAFSVKSLFDGLASEFIPVAKEKGISIRFVTSSLYIDSDRQAVERILRNLISNAIRYTDQGRVLVGCRRRSDSVVVSVYDTGIGIDPEKRDIIFEEFQQLNNHNRDRSKGLGLGLSIVKRLANLLGAGISLDSVPGRGSVFSIELPGCDSADITNWNFAELENHDDLAGRQILLIEDEVEIRQAISFLLNSWGCEVVGLTCRDDVKAELLASYQPDLILADYRLPNYETGVDVIRAIYDYYQIDDIPAIIITGDTDPERIKQAKQSGFQILHKPVSGIELYSLLNSVFQSK